MRSDFLPCALPSNGWRRQSRKVEEAPNKACSRELIKKWRLAVCCTSLIKVQFDLPGCVCSSGDDEGDKYFPRCNLTYSQRRHQLKPLQIIRSVFGHSMQTANHKLGHRPFNANHKVGHRPFNANSKCRSNQILQQVRTDNPITCLHWMAADQPYDLQWLELMHWMADDQPYDLQWL